MFFWSDERKARGGGQILAEGLGLGSFTIVRDLGENDRSATVFLRPDEFEATVDQFFAQPRKRAGLGNRSRRAGAGHSRGRAGHDASAIGGRCHYRRARRHRDAALLPSRRGSAQPAIRPTSTNGGNWFSYDRVSRKLLYNGWQSIEAPSQVAGGNQQCLGCKPH